MPQGIPTGSKLQQNQNDCTSENYLFDNSNKNRLLTLITYYVKLN